VSIVLKLAIAVIGVFLAILLAGVLKSVLAGLLLAIAFVAATSLLVG
jgi:hypothetical protein